MIGKNAFTAEAIDIIAPVVTALASASPFMTILTQGTIIGEALP
jgi:hypothetical protein